jgi:hypothetical protein
MPRLAQRPERYLHSPRLVARDDGTACLSLIAWQSDAEHLLRVEVAADGSLGEEQLGPPMQGIVALTRGDSVEVSDDSDAELCETRAGHRVWIDFPDGASEVWLAFPDGRRVLVFRARGSAAAPALVVTSDGAWVAFHHDVREDDGQPDVAKWIALRFVDREGQVYEPSAPMTDRDRDREGEQQSFEFPQLVLGDDGALALFGRGSHDYYRQDLSDAGFTPRLSLSDGSWGSRGRHIAAARVGQGIVIARREKGAIEVELLPPPRGQKPALRPAVVELGAPRAAAYGCVERARDPARHHGLITLFGDIQQHSAHSDGLGSADEVYVRARHRYGDDFVALTDHEAFLGKRTGPGEWEYLQRVAERHDDPGRFATLYAYEWTGKMYPGPGHKCVYYPARGAPIVSRDDVPEGAALVARVRGLGGFASPHHIGWTGADEAGHDEGGQPLWEICSCHGCYEHADHPLGQRGELRDQVADVMLKKGHRFGFTASSDSHGLLWHHGESRKRDPYRTGLTAVLAQGCTREAIMDALVRRRCYATSGVKILLDVRADGQPMGSILDDRREAELDVHAVGASSIDRIELLTDQGVAAVCHPAADEGRLRARVSGRYVYARVVQTDGEMAWASPVFFAR